MKYYLAKENFRLVDKGKYYSVHEVLELEEEKINLKPLYAIRQSGCFQKTVILRVRFSLRAPILRI